MTALPKAALATLLAAAVGMGIYEVRRATQRREPNPAPPPEQAAQAGAAPVAEPVQPVPGGSGELPPVVPISLAGLLVPAENDPWDKTLIGKIMPRGKQVFGGVEFWLEGLIRLQSSAARDANQSYRQSIVVPLAQTNGTAAGVQIVQRGSNVAAVHLLGATAGEGEGECTVAQLVWRYADGSRQSTQVRFQNHVRDCFHPPYETPTRLPYAFSKAVWCAPLPGWTGWSERLYRFSYANPEPGRVIQEIEFVSSMQAPSLSVVGLTLDPVPLGQRPDDSPNLDPTDPAPAEAIDIAVQTSDGSPIPNAKVHILVSKPRASPPPTLTKRRSPTPAESPA
jgi:hypothetical protein